MQLLNTPDATDDEEDILEDELVVLNDDQVEQLLQNVQESIERREESEMECDTEAPEATEGNMDADTEKAEGATDMIDNAALVMKGHSDAVFCVSVEPNGVFAASGGQDDVANIWNLQNGQCVHKCEGHEESVVGVSFNCDGSLLATGDISGIIQVWQCDSNNQWKLFWKCHEMSELLWLYWHPKVKNCLIAGSGDNSGDIFLWSVSVSNTKCKCLAGIGYGSVDGTVLSDGLTLVSIYHSPILRVWNIPQASVISTVSLADTDARKPNDDDDIDRTPICLAVKSNRDSHKSNTIAVGNASGEIIFINSSHWQIISTIWCNRRESVESIVFSNEHPYAAFCTVGGLFGVIDMTSMKIRHIREKEHGFTRLQWLEPSLNVISASLNGSLTMWNVRDATEIKQWTGHQDSVLDLMVYANNTRMISCGDCNDRCVRLFVNSE